MPGKRESGSSKTGSRLAFPEDEIGADSESAPLILPICVPACSERQRFSEPQPESPRQP